jgi:hypothetical protein
VSTLSFHLRLRRQRGHLCIIIALVSERSGVARGSGDGFYAVLDQVRDLLRQRGRVTYRALKLQFGLDDDQLEALKEELLYAQQRAVDEANQVLV